MLASSYFDPVLGIDLHFEMVPTPAPVPTPIPNPFTGIVFDPIGLAVGMAINGLISAVTGAKFLGPVLYWTAIPANNTGTNAKHIPGHILIPPGVAWAPFPKTPKPFIHPGETPKPALPVKPEDDATMIMGSQTVHVGGTNAVRLGELAMSCSEPVRLPSSVVLAVPKGAPILIGGPPGLDIMAAVMASLRTRFVSDSLHALVSRLKPSRFRTLLTRTVCFLTGHPVDVASGKVITHEVDAELPGPLPFKFERAYASAVAARGGPMGHGWSHSLDQAVWIERGKVVYLTDDGRELEFDTFDLPGHCMRPGDEVRHPIERATLRCAGAGRWQVETRDGCVREFAPVAGRDDGRAMIQRLRSASGAHEVAYSYDRRGRLDWVRDSGGRLIGLEHDDAGRLVALKLPLAHGRGWYVHRRYEYDRAGDLVRVVDSAGEAWTFEYVTHLLVRETDRAGLSFHFAYDGFGEDAYCIRTWGDGGLIDHTLQYDKQNKATFVTDALGRTTRYFMNVAGVVTKVIDPRGGEAQYEYDPDSLLLTRKADTLGRELVLGYDARGNMTDVRYPDGTSLQLKYDAGNRAVWMRDEAGLEWHHAYDRAGQLVERAAPGGATTRWNWVGGVVRSVESSDGARTEFEYDEQKNLAESRDVAGRATRYTWDGLGRVCKIVDARGHAARVEYDAEGRALAVHGPLGPRLRAAYDAEGNALELLTPAGRVRLRYGSHHKVVEREEAGAVFRFAYDAEARLAAVTNAAGETHAIVRDECGRVARVTDFDGTTSAYTRDAAGRVTEVLRASGRRTRFAYDVNDRMLRADHGDGSTVAFRYGPSGAVESVANGDTEVRYEYDAIGRMVREVRADADGAAFWVASAYNGAGQRCLVETSLGARQVIDYDTFGRAATLHHGFADGQLAEAVVQFERDVMGAETARLFPGGVRADARYDAEGRAVERRLVRTSRGGQPLAAESLEWLPNDKLGALIDTFRGATRFGYDAWGRLAEAWRGNEVTHRALRPMAPEPEDEAASRGFAAGGRLAGAGEHEYNADGNLVRKVDAAGEWKYRWNGAGHLAEVARPDGRAVRFGYDAFGRRIRKTLVARGADGREETERDTRFVWDGSVVVHELASDTGASTWHWEPGAFVPVVRNRGREWHSVVTDVAQVPVRMLDREGETAWKARRPISGAVQIEAGAREDCPWRGEGLYEDVETGLYYNRYRYLDPKLSRYLSKDPLGIRAGLDPYAHVDDPLTESDPLGLARKKSCGPTEPLPENCAIVSLSNGHASVRIVTEGEEGIMTHLLLHEPPARMTALERRAARQGAAGYNGAATRVTSDAAGFAPHTQIVIPLQDADAARAAAARQLELRGSTAAGRSGGRYQQGTNSCVTHVNDVLQHGGVDSTHGVMTGFEESLLEQPGAHIRR